MSNRDPDNLMVTNDDKFDYLFKIVLIGDCGTGKTCVVQRFRSGNFIERHGSTIGVDFSLKTVMVDGKKIKVGFLILIIYREESIKISLISFEEKVGRSNLLYLFFCFYTLILFIKFTMLNLTSFLVFNFIFIFNDFWTLIKKICLE